MHCVIAWVREMNGLKGNKKKWIGAVLGIVLGAVILFLPPPQGLSRDAMALMGVLVFAVCYWVFDVFPDYVLSLIHIYALDQTLQFHHRIEKRRCRGRIGFCRARFLW